MVTLSPMMTAAQLFEASGFERYELLQGELVIMTPAGFKHGRIAAEITAALMEFVKPRGLGVVVGAEAGFQIGRNPDTVRVPDVAFLGSERVPAAEPSGFYEGAPDLAVEVVSPNDRASEVLAKARDWLAAGCRAVWVVDPQTRTVSVHRTRSDVLILGVEDTLTGGDLLPGFSLVLAGIFTG